jgi:ribosomal protein L12E/L44/L45/RPP1/RPP2
MAQKGWDYDKVREERDQLRAYRDEANPALSFIKALAQKSNMSVSDYIDYCRKQELMNAGINEATAQAQINIEKQQAAIDAAQAEQRAAQEEAQRKQEAEERKKEEQRADLVRFMQAFPDVKAESIPKEVWASVQKGIPLTTAYTMYKNRALEAELTALKQNAEARERTPGSMNTAGEKHIDPDFDGWDDD